MKHKYIIRPWPVIAVLEAGAVACTLASLALGPFSFRSGQLAAWVALAVLLFATYLTSSGWLAALSARENHSNSNREFVNLQIAAVFVIALTVIQIQPGVVGALWSVTSPIQPFPIIAASLMLLLVFLLKAASTGREISSGEPRRKYWANLSSIMIPITMVLLGLLQATIYIIPIGNASLRFWAIADGIFLSQGYPLTLTEPGPMSAGSPPYVYDLPLFPLLIRLSFTLLGHDSAALHMPALIFSALFPLSMYLLIRTATGSGLVAVAFSALASLFPYLRFWVLNLPDPDPFLLTSLCFAAYLYLRALNARGDTVLWIMAGIAGGIASLARPEGILYVGFIGLGILAHRPRLKQLALYVLAAGSFVGPMVIVWMANYGFLWPQNYNKTLAPEHLLRTYAQLDTQGGIPLFYKGLGLGAEAALALAILFAVSVLFGTVAMVRGNRALLAMAVPAIANTVLLPFTNPWISNAFHYADFFRHASFGIPFLVMASAYGFHVTTSALSRGAGRRAIRLVFWLAVIAAIAREGDILANPTATHRPGSPVASQALTDDTHLSLQGIISHPMDLPIMAFYHDQNNAMVAYVPGLKWPDASFQYFAPLDITYDTQGRAFGYVSALSALLALALAFMSEKAPGASRASSIFMGPRLSREAEQPVSCGAARHTR